jgi:hypothetical protein
MDDQLILFFKVFCDTQRIRLAALLMEKAQSIEDIAAQLHIRAVDVPRHLEQLEKLNLLIEDQEGFRFNTRSFEQLSRAVLANHRPTSEAHSNDKNADDFDRKTVKNYSLPDGRLREIPMQDKKLGAILRHVVEVFKPGIRYTEKQVNEALSCYHEDTASLRRYLVDRKMIEREPNGTVYWRP